MATDLWVCEHLAPSIRDWCALASIPTDKGSGIDGMRICARMRTSTARDRCSEEMARHPVDPIGRDACAGIRRADMRETCLVENARRAASTDLPDAAAACAST